MPHVSRRTRLLNRLVLGVPPLCALTFIVWSHLLADRAAVSAVSIRPGAPVPTVSLRDEQGRAAELARITTGRSSVVVVVDPRCTHCNAELEALQRIVAHPESSTRRLVVISTGDTTRVAELWDRFPGVPIHVDVENALTRVYGLRAVPLLLVVSDGKTVADVHAGLQTEAALRRLLAAG